MLAALAGGAPPPTRIICCGHSLGGAVASLASVWAALQWPLADVRCFSFGSPKVGNRKFVRAMQTLVSWGWGGGGRHAESAHLRLWVTSEP